MPQFNYQECNRGNLAPTSDDDVWSCISRVVEHVNSLDIYFVAKVRGDNAVVFRSDEMGRNLITVWPRISTLAINLRASGPESQNRIDNNRVFKPAEFDLSFESIRNGIYEAFVG